MKRLTLFLCTALLFAPLLLSQQGYIPFATDFDGSADFYLRGADLDGNADGKEGVAHFWFKTSDSSAIQVIHSNSTGRVQVRLQADGEIRVIGADSADSNILLLRSSTAGWNDGNWHHCVTSWDLANAAGHLYVDGGEDLAGSPTLTDDVIDYTGSNWAVGAFVGGTSKFTGALSEVYFSLEFLDLSVVANRRLFITADLKPVDLGPGCHKPTGTVAIICLQTQFNGFGQNSGSGGDFTPQDPTTWTAGPVPILELPGRATPVRRGRGGSRRSTPRE